MNTRFSELLVIAATVAIISLLPALGDALVPASLAQGYDADPVPVSETHSLGTLRSSDMQGDELNKVNDYRPVYSNRSTTADDYRGENPEPVTVGSVTYITGGVGSEERDVLEAAKPSYNLHVVSTSKSGQFIGDTHVIVRNRQGSEMLNLASGPILLAKIPPGSYLLAASSEGVSKTQPLLINGKKAVFIRLIWN